MKLLFSSDYSIYENIFEKKSSQVAVCMSRITTLNYLPCGGAFRLKVQKNTSTQTRSQRIL